MFRVAGIVTCIALTTSPAMAEEPSYRLFAAFVTGEKWHDFSAEELNLPGCSASSKLHELKNGETVEELFVECEDFRASIKPQYSAKKEFQGLRSGLDASLLLWKPTAEPEAYETVRNRFSHAVQHIPIWITPKSDACQLQKWTTDWRIIALTVAGHVDGIIDFQKSLYDTDGRLLLASFIPGDVPATRFQDAFPALWQGPLPECGPPNTPTSVSNPTGTRVLFTSADAPRDSSSSSSARRD